MPRKLPDPYDISQSRMLHYALGGSSHRHAVPVKFTMADLDKLAADKVLAPRDGTWRVQAGLPDAPIDQP